MLSVFLTVKTKFPKYYDLAISFCRAPIRIEVTFLENRSSLFRFIAVFSILILFTCQNEFSGDYELTICFSYTQICLKVKFLENH